MPQPTTVPQPSDKPQSAIAPDKGQTNEGIQGQEGTSGANFKPVIRVNVKTVPLKVGQSTNKVKVTYAKGDSVKSWKSSNKKVVTVNKKGILKAGKKTGKATVTVTLNSGLQAKIQVKVQENPVQTASIRISKKNLLIKKGFRHKLTPVILPSYFQGNSEIYLLVHSSGKSKQNRSDHSQKNRKSKDYYTFWKEKSSDLCDSEKVNDNYDCGGDN